MYNKPTALRSVLAPKYLEHCLSCLYDIGEWKDCLFWLRGLNDTYRLRTSRGYYILRVYRQSVSENDVAYEMSLLTQLDYQLSSASTKVSVPVLQKDGGSFSVIHAPEGPRVAVIFSYLTGTENVLHDEKSCFAFGKSAAELHAAMDNISLELPRYNMDTNALISQPLERIVDYLGEGHHATPFLREFSDALIERIHKAASQGLDWGICHGDLHGNNNAFQEGDTFTHYDFEWAAKGWRAYDLVQVRHRKRLPEEKKTPLWNTLISGYRSVRDFSEQDESAMDLFIIARRLWVMGLDVEFIHDSGALDFTEDWLEEFITEFRSYPMV
ncbi:phosphotransferase [Paenibacillus tritici]|uniref:Phosphotransferase n=1 Tax=Paenibacillus tritici TaxID=1873425 RepID=A0ABX2DPD3_9BACL|nr:phosphotransferase [Paenibacillus tritici]